jgi:hypothetical protein
MRTRCLILAGLALAGCGLRLGGQPATANFPEYGFCIQPLDTAPGNRTMQTLMMFLPVSQDFTPNVNVEIEPATGAFADFVDSTKKQFEQMGVKFLTDKTPNPNEWIAECAGQMQTKSVHWYIHAVYTGKSIYLATGTALEVQWAEWGDKMRKCVDSLQALASAPASTPATAGATVPAK